MLRNTLLLLSLWGSNMASPTGISYDEAIRQGWNYDQSTEQWSAPGEGASPTSLSYSDALAFGWKYDDATGKWTPPDKGFDPEAARGNVDPNATYSNFDLALAQQGSAYSDIQAAANRGGQDEGGFSIGDVVSGFGDVAKNLAPIWGPIAGYYAAPAIGAAAGIGNTGGAAVYGAGLSAATGGNPIQGAATAAGLSYAGGSLTGTDASGGSSSAPGENLGGGLQVRGGAGDNFGGSFANEGGAPAVSGAGTDPSYLGSGLVPGGRGGLDSMGGGAGVTASGGAVDNFGGSFANASPSQPLSEGGAAGSDLGSGAITNPVDAPVATSGGGTGGLPADVPGTEAGGAPLGNGLQLDRSSSSNALALGGGGLGAASLGGSSGGGGGGSLGGGETLGGQELSDGSMSGGDYGDYGTTFSEERGLTSGLSDYWDKIAGGLGIAGSALLKYGPLALGVAGFSQAKKSGQAAATQLKQVGTPQADLGKSLVDGYQNGTLNPADTAAIDRWAAQQVAAIKQQMANAGTSDSTQSLAMQREITARAEEMKAVSRENLLKIGLGALNTSDQYQVAAIQAELNADQNAINFASKFMGTYAQWLYSGSRMVAPTTQSQVG